MSKVSKAIAAFISSTVALLLAMGLISPALADQLGPAFAAAVATIIGAVGTTAGVYFSPKNAG